MAYRASDEARDFAIGEYQIGRLTRKATINFGAPVTGPAGEVHAVVFAALDLGWLAQRVGEQQIVPGSRVTVFDKKGTVLAHHPDTAAQVGHAYADVPIVRTIMERRRGAAEGRDVDGARGHVHDRAARAGAGRARARGSAVRGRADSGGHDDSSGRR